MMQPESTSVVKSGQEKHMLHRVSFGKDSNLLCYQSTYRQIRIVNYPKCYQAHMGTNKCEIKRKNRMRKKRGRKEASEKEKRYKVLKGKKKEKKAMKRKEKKRANEVTQ